MESLSARLKAYLAYKKITISQLANTLGYEHPQKFYRIFNSPELHPSCNTIEEIAEKFPDINLNWLFRGNGDMISRTSHSDYHEKYCSCLEQKDRLYQQIVSLIDKQSNQL